MNTASLSKMPARLKNAVPHSRIHRYYYYWWMSREVFTRTSANTKTKFIKLLIEVQFKLQTGSFPNYVMLPKGAKKENV